MQIELITKDDLKSIKDEIINEIATLLKSRVEKNEWLKSKDVRKVLNCSPGTLQSLRISGVLPFSKVGGTIYYALEDVNKVLNESKVF